MRRKSVSLIDTNIFLRYLLWDDPPRASRCQTLFQRLERGEETARVLDLTVAEVVWTLQKHFGVDRRRIRDLLRTILEFKGLKVSDKMIVLKALDVFAERAVDFPDAYIAEAARPLGLQVYSYDRDLTILKVNRREP